MENTFVDTLKYLLACRYLVQYNSLQNKKQYPKHLYWKVNYLQSQGTLFIMIHDVKAWASAVVWSIRAIDFVFLFRVGYILI